MADDVDVLLVIPDHRLRAFALAELLEQGYEVMAVPRARHARALLRAGVSPRLVIVDLVGLAENGDALRDLLGDSPERLLVLVGALERQEVAHLPPCRVLGRPFTVGQLVERVQRLLGS